MKPRLFALLSIAFLAGGCAAGSVAASPAEDAHTANQAPAGAQEQAEDRAVAWAMGQGKRALQREQWEQARDYFTGVIDRDPDHAWAHYYLAVALEKLGQERQAERSYSRALMLKPSLVEASVSLSSLLLAHGRVDEAAVVVRSALHTAASEPRLHANLAEARLRAKDRDGARAELALAAGLTGDPHLRLRIAQLFEDLDEPQEALRVLRALRAQTHVEPAVLELVGERLGRLQAHTECVAALDQVLRVRATPSAHVRRGACLHALGDDLGARRDYAAAIRLDPEHAQAHYQLADLYLATGEKKKALEAWRRCAELAADSDLGDQAKKRIRQVTRR